MYIFKNAWKNVTRSKGRNFLIGLIVVVISVSACVSLSIRVAADKAKEEGMESNNITAQITMDRQKMMQSASEAGQDRSQMREKMSEMGLSLSDLQKYAKSTSVKDFYYTLTASFNGNNIEEVSTDTSTDDSSSDSSQTPPGGSEMRGGGNRGSFSVVGYSGEDAMTDFISGTCKITSGKMFTEATTSNQCIISDELATYNSLKVGSTIKLESPTDDSQTISLMVVGIYNNSSSTSSENGPANMRDASSDPANQIYTSYAALNKLTKDNDAIMTQTNGTYVLNDYDAYKAFEKDVDSIGLEDNYTVSSQDVTSYEQSLVPLENLSNFATYFFVIVLIIGGIILIVINIFNIRERKYEIGVLTAIGMKKNKVCAQFVMELFFVTVFSMVIGLGIGSVASVPVSNQLLKTQVESQEAQAETQDENFGRGGAMGGAPSQIGGKDISTTATSYITDISASVNMVVVMQLFGIGILLTIISSLTAVIFVVRYKPLKILTNRS